MTPEQNSSDNVNSTDMNSISVNSSITFNQTVTANVRPFTNYTVLVEGVYRSYNVNDVVLGPVIANGTATSLRTACELLP